MELKPLLWLYAFLVVLGKGIFVVFTLRLFRLVHFIAIFSVFWLFWLLWVVDVKRSLVLV